MNIFMVYCFNIVAPDMHGRYMAISELNEIEGLASLVQHSVRRSYWGPHSDLEIDAFFKPCPSPSGLLNVAIVC